MADLKLLTERVVEKEKAAIRSNIEEKRKNAEDEIQASKANAEQEKQTQKAAIDEEFEHEYNIRKNTLEIQKRNNVLKHKQEILSKVLADTKEQLANIDASTFQTFLSGVLNQFEGQGQVECILGEKSQGLVNQDWINQQDVSNLQVNLSNETVKDEAGVIIHKDGIEYNFLFNELVEDLKSELLPEISRDLFN